MWPNWYSPPRPSHNVGADDVIRTVAQFYHISPADIRGGQRNRLYVDARWVCAEALRRKGRLSFPAIGRLLNRDHTTVMHGCREFDNAASYRPEMKRALRLALR